MSVYEDVKKAIQDFLAPDIAALREAVDQNEKRAQERHVVLLREIEWRFDSMKQSLELSRRMDALERKEQERKAG